MPCAHRQSCVPLGIEFPVFIKLSSGVAESLSPQDDRLRLILQMGNPHSLRAPPLSTKPCFVWYLLNPVLFSPHPPFHGPCCHCNVCFPISSLPKPMVHPVTKNKLRTVSLIAQSCPNLCNPMDCSTPGFPAHHKFPELTQIHVHRVGDAIQPSHPLSSPSPPSFNLSSIRVFSNESLVRIRWPKCWSFSFNISSSNEYSGLIYITIDWLDFLAVQGTLKSLPLHYSSKA